MSEHHHHAHHEHQSPEHGVEKNAHKVRLVFWLTLMTMLAEIVVGTWSGSMALLADGWHMGTHAAAFAITMYAYHYAKKHLANQDFSFGTAKVHYLGGFASAVALAVVALLMAIESVERIVSPHAIHFNEAIVVAFVGLAVNIASVFILHDQHHHHHGHDDHGHHHYDHNLKAAYFHVLADALTSILAIVALFAGRELGWLWLDAIMGIVGAIIISKWAFGLLRESSQVLLDKSSHELAAKVQSTLAEEVQWPIARVNLWRLGQQDVLVVITLQQTHREPQGGFDVEERARVDHALREALGGGCQWLLRWA